MPRLDDRSAAADRLRDQTKIVPLAPSDALRRQGHWLSGSRRQPGVSTHWCLCASAFEEEVQHASKVVFNYWDQTLDTHGE